MKIDSTLTTIKNIRRRVVGYAAHFHSLGAAREHLTKDEATADLATMITFRCQHESAEVKIVSVRGHVGVCMAFDDARYESLIGMYLRPRRYRKISELWRPWRNWNDQMRNLPTMTLASRTGSSASLGTPLLARTSF